MNNPSSVRHPRGLYVLFFTEMWERFGFYLMVGIFVALPRDTVKRRPRHRRRAGRGHRRDLRRARLPDAVHRRPDRRPHARLSQVDHHRRHAHGDRLLPARRPRRRRVHVRVARPAHRRQRLLQAEHLDAGRQPLQRRRAPLKKDAAYNIFYMGINIGAFAATSSPPTAQPLRLGLRVRRRRRRHDSSASSSSSPACGTSSTPTSSSRCSQRTCR